MHKAYLHVYTGLRPTPYITMFTIYALHYAFFLKNKAAHVLLTLPTWIGTMYLCALHRPINAVPRQLMQCPINAVPQLMQCPINAVPQ
jgi:hypothetical protein